LLFPNTHLKDRYSLANNKTLLLGATLLTIAIVYICKISGFEKHVLALLLCAPLFVLFLAHTDFFVFCTVVLIFANIDALAFKMVVLSSLPVAVSYLVTWKKNIPVRVPNPLFAPLVILILTMLPSMANSHNLAGSIYQMFNLFSMAILFLVLGNQITGYGQIKAWSIVFVFLSLCNGITIIIQNVVTGNRVFGFSGIMYVDFVCVAIIICLIAMLFYRNWRSFVFFPVALLLLVSLFFTQTRNTMISLAVSCVFLFFFLFLYHRTFSIARKKMLLITTFSLIVTCVALGFLYLLVPQIFDRFVAVFSKKGNSGGLVSSTLISRLLIWHTAFNAFIEHPIIGIGAYAFGTDSHYYSRLPTWLYKDWVQGLSEHVTYLAVATETGVLGLLGFVIFLVSALHLSFKSIFISVSEKQKYYSLGFLLLQVYIAVSMAMTDAWRWGQCGMLWGLVLGASVANYRIITRSVKSLGKEQ
jgi:O-antigen ligase